MGTQRRDFIFRNRRLFLLALAAVTVAGTFLLPLSTGERLARFLNDHVTGPGLEFWTHTVYGLAAVLIGLGAFWRTWGSAYLGTHVVQDRQMHTDRLVGDGPYRHTRNPLYFGNMLMVFGLGILIGPLGYLILVVGMWILVRLFIRDEELGLEESGGESFRAYRAAVPRLAPSWSPRIPPAGAHPRWLQGFCGEGFLWMLAFLTAALAVTLDPIWFHQRGLWAFVIVLPLYVWARRYTKKQAATGSA
jgi:protein-S-isoprenylcysteine O-methyltransferase Ste14